MAIDVLDSRRDTPDSIMHLGEAGELVCRQPFPSEPLAFHGKGGFEKYQSSYFERFGNDIWCQGDLIQIQTDTQGLIMLGRSYVFLSAICVVI